MTARVSSATGQFILSITTTMKTSRTTLPKISSDAGGEHLVERVDVGGDAGDEAADGVLVEEADILDWMWRKISRRMSNMIFWPVHCIR